MFRQFENFIRTNCQWTIIHVIEWPTMLKKEAISWNRIEQVAFFPWTNPWKRAKSTEHLPEKNSEQTVWMTFSFGVCLSFTNCLRTSVWKVNETRLYGLFQGKFPGATEHLKRLSCFFSLLDEMFQTEICVSLVKSHLWVSFKPWDWFVWIIGPNREWSVAHVNGKQIRSSRILSRKYN